MVEALTVRHPVTTAAASDSLRPVRVIVPVAPGVSRVAVNEQRLRKRRSEHRELKRTVAGRNGRTHREDGLSGHRAAPGRMPRLLLDVPNTFLLEEILLQTVRS